MNKLLGLLAATALLAGSAAGQTPTTPTTTLGSWHTDSLLGYALRRPAGAEMRRETSPNELVRFNLRDSRTGAVRVCMRIMQATEKKQDTDKLAVYAKRLADQLKTQQGYALEPGYPRLTMAGGKPAIEFLGPMGVGSAKLLCRDVWVLTEPKRFLVIRTAGPLGARADVIRHSRASIQTLRFFDPTAARKKRQAELARGAAVLESLTPARIRQAVAKRDYWLVIIAKGKMLGFIHYTEKTASREHTQGVLVTSEMVIKAKSGPRSITRQDMYASFDRKIERWETTTAVPGGKQLDYELGLKQNELLALQHIRRGLVPKDSSLKAPTKIYLPLAMSPMLPRLLDRTKPGTYAFAQYDSRRRTFALRTVEVVGPRKITIGNRSFDTVLMRQQMSPDDPKADVYLAANGLPLKVVPAEGATLQQTTAEAVRRGFPEEWQLLWPSGRP